jgi:hypothetical protein
MWLALVMVCYNPSALSCQVIAKPNELYISEEECNKETQTAVQYFTTKGALAIPSCFKVGTSL